MKKQICKRIASVLAMVMLLTSFAFTMPVNAASKADMKKANVKWDLKNNKTLKFKTKWSVIGVKTHTVKMTKFKIKNAKKKGYKQCTFTLTFNRKINPTKKQTNDMYWISQGLDMSNQSSEGGNFGGGCYYTVVDYNTGKSLEGKNNKNVTVTRSDYKYSKKDKKTTKDGFYIWYYQKITVNVKIVYPKKYKNLAIGVGGYSSAPYSWSEIKGGSASGGIKGAFSLKKFWAGKTNFSKETKMYSKKDKSFAHFMRVK